MSTFGAGDARSDRRRDCDFRIRRGARAGRVRQAYLQCSSTQRTSPARAENPHEREKESQKRLACVSLEPEPMKKRKKSAKPSKKMKRIFTKRREGTFSTVASLRVLGLGLRPDTAHQDKDRRGDGTNGRQV